MINQLVDDEGGSTTIMIKAVDSIQSGTDLLVQTQQALEAITSSVTSAVQNIQEITNAIPLRTELGVSKKVFDGKDISTQKGEVQGCIVIRK